MWQLPLACFNVKQQIDKDFKKDQPNVSFKLVHAIIHTTNNNIQNKQFFFRWSGGTKKKFTQKLESKHDQQLRGCVAITTLDQRGPWPIVTQSGNHVSCLADVVGSLLLALFFIMSAQLAKTLDTSNLPTKFIFRANSSRMTAFPVLEISEANLL